MELWIRSQDKKRLVKAEHIYYCEDEFTNNELKYYICTIGAYDLGIYETKERALEVLDEIEERISLLNTMSVVNDINTLISFNKAIGEDKIKGLSYPYQMPKE